jgi:hypothetical protein
MKLLKLSLSIVLAIGLCVPIQAQRKNNLDTSNVQISNLVWMSCEGTNCVGLTVDATAGGVTLTSAKYSPTVTDQPSGFSQAQVAICSNSGAKIWVSDGTSFTLATARGMPVNDGSTFIVYGFTNISNMHLIRDAAVSSTVFCNYYRQP